MNENEVLDYQQHTAPRPDNINGWLLLPMIGMFITPIFAISSLITLINAADNINLVDSTIQMIAIIEGIGNIIFIIFPIYILINFFQHKKITPKLFIFFYIFSLVINLTMLVLLNSSNSGSLDTSNELIEQAIKSFIVASIWIPYFIYSDKVKRTFVL